MRTIKILLYATILSITGSFFGQSLKVGEEILKTYESPHPYANSSNTGSLAWSESIKYDGATYIAVHFSKFELAEGDYLLVKSPDNERSWKYTNRGNYNSSKPEEGFWSIPIYGNELLIELYKNNTSNDYYGYTIDRFARGYTENEMNGEGDFESLCGSDNSLNAKCYQSSEPTVYNRSRAVARLLINGTGACTGWLIGDQGHIMTNNHCVGSSSDANNVTVEFMAEGSSCATSCTSWFGCSGTIAASSTGLVQTNVNLDYSLLSLPTNVSGTYGFLQLRPAGASVGERLYIPQHPQAWGKRIAVVSDHSSDASDGNAHITSITSPRCGGSGYDVGYYADTQGGSSGSPVLGYSDHLVISLHHCGNCPNRGVPIQEIIANLGSNIPNNAIGCIPSLVVTGNVTAPNTDTRQAGNTITATNTINSGATGIYHAGAEVVLKSGFNAVAGSNFRAYIEGCSGLFVARQPATVADEHFEEDKIRTVSENGANVAPNPSNGIFKIYIEKQTQGTIEISDLYGFIVLQTKFKNENEFQINMQDSPKGIYIVRIILTDRTYTQKIIKN